MKITKPPKAPPIENFLINIQSSTSHFSLIFKIDFSKDDNVIVLDGPFANYDGLISNVDEEKGKRKLIEEEEKKIKKERIQLQDEEKKLPKSKNGEGKEDNEILDD